VLLVAATALKERTASGPVAESEVAAMAAQIEAFGERFDQRDLDVEAKDAAKMRRKDQVNDPKPGLFEGIDPDNPPRGWIFDDKVDPEWKPGSPPPAKQKVSTTITDPTGASQTIRRSYDRKTGTWTLESAFLDKLEAWIPASIPMTSRGINLVTYATLRQEKLVGIEPGDTPGGDKIKKQKISTIVNERTMLELAQFTGGDESKRNDVVERLHSYKYALTALTQGRYRVVPGTAVVDGGAGLKVRAVGQVEDMIAAKGEQETQAWLDANYPGAKLDTETWWGMDILYDVEALDDETG
jgi:hypothetical protein